MLERALPKAVSEVRQKMEMNKKTLFFSLQNTQQAPERRLVIMLCMSGLLNFHSHDIVGLSVTEDDKLTVADSLLAIGHWRLAMDVIYC